MRASDVYPHDALTGSCFVTGDYDPSHGIVDLEIYLDALPPFGRLCVSGTAVRDMVTCLGLQWPDADIEAELVAALEESARLRAENVRLRKAIARIVDAARMSAIEDWMVSPS